MTNARDKANIPTLNFSSTGIDDNATSTAITIDSNNDVGIGTNSPGAYRLNVSDTANTNIRVTESTNNILLDLRANTTGGLLRTTSNHPFVFGINQNEIMRLTSTGLGIGTSSPGEKIHAESSVATKVKAKTTTSTTLGGFEAWGNSTSYLKMYQFGSSYGGTTFGGVTGNNQAVIEAQEVSSLAFTTQGGTPDIIFAPARTARMTIKNGGDVIVNSGSLSLVGTNTKMSASSNGDDIQFSFNGSVKATLNNGGRFGAGDGSAVVPGFRFKDDADTGMFRPSNNIIAFSTNASEKARITSGGKVLFNTTTTDNGMVISNGTDTHGNNACYGLERGSYKSTIGMTSVGGMTLKNFSGEINVIDSSGNSTTISPHNFSTIPNGPSEELAWAYYSRKGDEENDFDNTKYISADITKVIRKVENLTGEKLIYSGTANTDDGSTVSENIIQALIDRIESLETEVTALKNQP